MLRYILFRNYGALPDGCRPQALIHPVQSEIQTFKLSVDNKLDGLFSSVKEAAYIQRTSNLSLSNSRTVFNFASVSGLYSRKSYNPNL